MTSFSLRLQSSAARTLTEPYPETPPTYIESVSEKQSWFQWRTAPSFGLAEAVVLSLYMFVTAIALSVHEPWADEAQAWMLARDNSLWTIFHTRLHYEGAPMLWHTILHTLSVLHVPWTVVPWIGALFASSGIFVFLRWSPFPLLLRVLLPFTFFLQHQYAVIARSYVLFPLLLFSLCIVYSSKRKHVILFAVLAGLLVNISMHGAVIGCTLAALYAWKLKEDQRQRNATVIEIISPPSKRRIYSAAAIFLVLFGLAAYAAIPAPDVDFAISDTIGDGPIHTLLLNTVGEMPYKKPLPPPQFAHYKPFQEPFGLVHPPLWHPLEWAAWQSYHPDMAGGPVVAGLCDNLLTIASEMTWPIAQWNILAIAFLAAWIIWMKQQGRLRLMLPWLFVILVGSFLWVADHHVGLFFVTLIACAWMACNTARQEASPQVNRVFLVLFCAIAVVQVGWTVISISSDADSLYDPGKATADYIQQHPVSGKTAAFGFGTTSIQQYFKQNPFFNLPTQYWIWSTNVGNDQHYGDVLAQHPARIVYAVEWLGDGAMRNQLVERNKPLLKVETSLYDILLMSGYHETKRFCGVRFSRASNSYKICDLIMEPNEIPTQTALLNSKF